MDEKNTEQLLYFNCKYCIDVTSKVPYSIDGYNYLLSNITSHIYYNMELYTLKGLKKEKVSLIEEHFFKFKNPFFP